MKNTTTTANPTDLVGRRRCGATVRKFDVCPDNVWPFHSSSSSASRDRRSRARAIAGRNFSAKLLKHSVCFVSRFTHCMWRAHRQPRTSSRRRREHHMWLARLRGRRRSCGAIAYQCLVGRPAYGVVWFVIREGPVMDLRVERRLFIPVMVCGFSRRNPDPAECATP
jgi:hypothetical protein